MIFFRTSLLLLAMSATLVAQLPPETSSSSQLAGTDFSHARLLLDQGKYDEAIAELKQLSATQPRLKGMSHELGMAYYKKGDYFHAAESFKQALQQDSQDNEATQMLGLSYYLSGKPADAIPFLEKLQNWYPRANLHASYILGQ